MTLRIYRLDQELVFDVVNHINAIGEGAGPALADLRLALAAQPGELDPPPDEPNTVGVDLHVRIGTHVFSPLPSLSDPDGAPPISSSWGHTNRTLVRAILQAALDDLDLADEDHATRPRTTPHREHQ